MDQHARPAESFTIDGTEVMLLCDGTEMEPTLSPRPYLHPIRTLGGVPVTTIRPADHLHHYGLSLAIASLDGVMHWGGRSYVAGVGSTMLANHGRQVIVEQERNDQQLTMLVHWLDPEGQVQAKEQRVIGANGTDAGWRLTWRSELTPTRDMLVESSATKGRTGAGYGGIFWRFPEQPAQVTTIDGEGESAAHGSLSPWLEVAGPDWRVRLHQAGAVRPWFVRVDGYIGAGPALAWEQPLTLRAGEPLAIGLDADIASTTQQYRNSWTRARPS